MNLFEKSRTWLPSQVRAAAGVDVTYTRSATSLSVTAVVGRTVFASNVDGGARIEFGDRDYLVLASDLEGLGPPRIGDRITEEINGSEVVFEVQTPDTGEPHWRYSDTARAVYRIHVKRVS